MTDTDIHSCGYYCDKPVCIKAQRDELRNKLFSEQAVKTYSGGKPNYTQPIEPVAWWHDRGDVVDLNVSGHGIPLYTKKEWVGLTEEERLEAEDGCSYMDAFELTLYAEKIEAKLKEKNND